MSTPTEEVAPGGFTEVLATIRQAIEQMAQQNAEFKAQIVEQQTEVNSRLTLLTTAQAAMAQQIAHIMARQTEPSHTPAPTDAPPIRSLGSVLASMDRRANAVFSTTTSTAEPLTPIKQEPGLDRGQAHDEDVEASRGADVPPPIKDEAMPEYQSRDTRHPLPIRRFNYNPTHDGLTGVIIGDQVPFEHRLTRFDAYSVFMWLQEVRSYQDMYQVTVNLVNYVTEDILGTIAASMQSMLDLPKRPRTWSPSQLKIAMTRYFTTYKYTPKVLCEIAERVTPFPQTGPRSANSTLARQAIVQLAQVPLYCVRLALFHTFVNDFRLLEQGWPTEHNKDWGHPKRLNEVLAETLKRSAPQAYSQISDELTQHRKLSITALLAILPEVARMKVHDLHLVDETLEKLDRTNTKPPDKIGTTGVGRPYPRAPVASPDPKAANHVSSKFRSWGPTLQGPKLNHLGEVEDGSEDEEHDTWREKESALELEPETATMDAEGINHIHATTEAAVDRSKQICHSHLFHPQGCVNTQRGKPCPFSHEAKVGIEELTKVLEKLKRN